MGVHIGAGIGGASRSRIAYAADRALSLVRGADGDHRRPSQDIGVRFDVTLRRF
jgi:hypothetical protein